MSITLTQKAAEKVSSSLSREGGLGLRIRVKTTGCSGMAYKLELAKNKDGDDKEFQSHGVSIIIDEKSLKFVDGSEIDYTKENLQEGFKFNNPNVKDVCGCGESFTV